MKSDNIIVNRLFWAVALAVCAIALGSFSLSFMALYALATENGVPALLGWIWPLIVDVSMVIYTAAILVAHLQRRGAKLPVGLTVFYAVVTITGNLLHAPATWLGWFVAALPPLSLIFGTEMLRAMAHHIILQQGTVDTLHELNARVDALAGQVDAKRQELNTLTAQIEQVKQEESALIFRQNSPKIDTLNDARADKKQARMDALLHYFDHNPQASMTEAGQEIGVSRQTIGNYVNELSGAGKLHRNGNGWEVTR